MRDSPASTSDSPDLSADACFALDIASKKLRPGGVLDIRGTHIRARHYVGIFAFNGLQFEIVPKTIGNHRDNTQALQNLLWMVQCTRGIKLAQSAPSELLAAKAPFFDALIIYFADLVLAACKLGFPLLYISQDEMLTRPRGRMLFASSVRQHRGNETRWACRFDELTVAHVLTFALRTVLRSLADLAQNHEARRRVQEALDRTATAGDAKVSYPDIACLRVPSVNRPFADAVELAKLALQQQALHPQTGEQMGPSFLINMQKLFEQYLISLLNRYQDDLSLRHVQSNRKSPLIEDIFDYNTQASLRTKIMSYSDAVVVTQAGVRVVLDTKYKIQPYQKAGSTPVSETADIYQIMTYQSLHSTGTQVCRGALIYPRQAGVNEFLRLCTTQKTSVYVKTLATDLRLATQEVACVQELKQLFTTIDRENSMSRDSIV